MEKLFAEAYRLRLLQGLEELISQCGYTQIAGVDEAGRGALAGPVVAAAVIPRPDRTVPAVDDSKQLQHAGRLALAEAIRDASLATAVIAVSAADIDRINILEASRLAMTKAVASLTPQPDYVVTDAMRLPACPHPTLPVVRGDAVSYSVACASILAKTERDRLMIELGDRYPQYGLDGHKGYGAASHREALAVYGPSPIHRLTFRSVLPSRESARGAA